MRIAIIGLGLIGGSMARRLKGFRDCTIVAYNRSQESIDLALADGVIDEGYNNPKDAMRDADLIIMCLYPQLNVDFVRDNLDVIKDGAVITDVTGVKGFIDKEMKKILPNTSVSRRLCFAVRPILLRSVHMFNLVGVSRASG